jgi:hypothetical protein
MNTFPSDAGNAMNMATSLENALSIRSKKKETQKAARTMKDSCSRQAKDDREEGCWKYGYSRDDADGQGCH